jgi:hypothetical protein
VPMRWERPNLVSDFPACGRLKLSSTGAPVVCDHPAASNALWL